MTHRVRVGDDFGLTRAGIVFRFNDGEEKTLLLKEFAAGPGKRPQTVATIEETLLMETLAASPQDSVTYFAFAEDNFPDAPRRTETDLRYIDIRPFKREYQLADPSNGQGEPDEFVALEELIGRQRFNLNRANRLARHRPTDRVEPEDPLKIAGFEEALLAMAREFTEGIERLADARVDSMHRAEEAMVAAVDALDRSRNAEAPGAMSEALKNLVAARRELVELIGQTPAAAMAMRSFDRKQAQKIRNPKTKDEEAEQVAEEIEQLAQEEDFVYATIAKRADSDTPGKAKEQKGSGEPRDAKTTEPTKNRPGTKDGDAEKEARSEAAKGNAKGSKGQGSPGKGSDPGDTSNGRDRRETADKQEEIADEARALEERLKRIEAASDLAKARMGQAAEKAEKASGALNRGNTSEAEKEAKAGAGMLHELARQVKGEIAREVADEIAMARDLAQELAAREEELARMAENSGNPAEGRGEGKEPGRASSPGTGPGGRGRGGLGDWTNLDGPERLERLAEAAKTLEEWLKGIDRKGEGKAADVVRDILQQGTIHDVVERTGRMAEVRSGGKPQEIVPEAKAIARSLEVLGQSLELLHRGIVAPRLAAMVEFDRRVAELAAKLAHLHTDAQITAWHREAAALIRDLEKAGIAEAAELAEALKAGGWNGRNVGWGWADGIDSRVAPGGYTNALRAVSTAMKDQIQEMMLKDLASARDEAAPPRFREMIDRYYEVLSK